MSDLDAFYLLWLSPHPNHHFHKLHLACSLPYTIESIGDGYDMTAWVAQVVSAFDECSGGRGF